MIKGMRSEPNAEAKRYRRDSTFAISDISTWRLKSQRTNRRRVCSPLVADEVSADDCTRCVFDWLIVADIGRAQNLDFTVTPR